jgi:hypothetical protein
MQEICAQTGFPSRPSIFSTLRTPAHVRIASSLRTLLAVSEELFRERVAAGVPPEDAACVLLFDRWGPGSYRR